MRILLTTLAAACLFANGGNRGWGQDEGRKADAPTAVRVLRSWTGAKSGVKAPRAEIITDEDSWKKTWAEHDASAERPPVDFGREMVVVIFSGDSWNSRGYRVTETLEGDLGATILRVQEETFQSDGKGDRVTPFGFFVFTRTDRTLIVEKNVQDILGHPPLWSVLTARIEMICEPSGADFSFRPVRSWAGAGGSGDGKVRSAVSRDQWKELWSAVAPSDPDGGGSPEVDWDRHVAVAFTDRIQREGGDYLLTFVGANDRRTVVRIHAPAAPSDGAPDTVNRFAVWILPKPKGALAVETPQYGRPGQPPLWRETVSIRMK